MSSMVERVARVIRDGYADRKGEFAIARAAIAALREPTEKMYDAGVEVEDKNLIPENGAIAGFVWQAMIDAALSEGAQ